MAVEEPIVVWLRNDAYYAQVNAVGTIGTIGRSTATTECRTPAHQYRSTNISRCVETKACWKALVTRKCKSAFFRHDKLIASYLLEISLGAYPSRRTGVICKTRFSRDLEYQAITSDLMRNLRGLPTTSFAGIDHFPAMHRHLTLDCYMSMNIAYWVEDA